MHVVLYSYDRIIYVIQEYRELSYPTTVIFQFYKLTCYLFIVKVTIVFVSYEFDLVREVIMSLALVTVGENAWLKD